ncbi:MAG TPA: DUF885 domain-containing protein [Gemmatimonadales bacterium]|nr:DUF885 domain-containing protein [Gemmatimonadales bacterium]
MSVRPLRRALTLLAPIATVLACSRPAAQPHRPTTDPATATTALADEYFAGLVERTPELATFWGLKHARHDRVFDGSRGAFDRWRAREDAWLARLNAVDLASLDGKPEAVSSAILRESLESAQRARVCRGELWSVDQLSGWQVTYPRLGALQPLGDSASRSQALARWRGMPRLIDQSIENLREGVRQGYTAPRGNVDAVLQQVDALIAAAPRSSPFALMAQRDSTPEFRQQLFAIVGEEIGPALKRYRTYLRDEYRAKARTDPAVAALPNGAECYRATLRGFTTLDLEPKQVHELGLREIARIDGEMRTIGARSFGTTDVKALMERLRTDSKYTFRSRDELIRSAEEAVARAKAAAPRMFNRMPKADMIVDPCQPFEEKSGCPGSYYPASEDGSRPGRYRINAGSPRTTPRAASEATAFHEGIPGHHFQIALAAERPEAHPITRYLLNSGFVEGWALYAEQVANELGLYSSDLDQLGRLSSDALRAARLVVDAGIHALGWTRQQAIDYMAAHTAASKAFIESEVDRYIITPGQATAYMVGRLEIERLRRDAEQRMGNRFDIRAFHDRVLEDGSVPLSMLQRKIERWVTEQAKPATS